jgi:adenylyltransferase/sulfurtransferase
LGPAVAVIAALEVVEGLKILLDQRQALLRSLVMVDLWTGDFERAQVQKGATPCPVCDEGRYEMLTAEHGATTAVLCGRGAVQISPRRAPGLDLEALAARLAEIGPVSVNPYLLRFAAEGCEFTVFRDGRAILKGVSDPVEARVLYARYVGS